MKKATATSQGSNRFTDSPGGAGGAETMREPAEIMAVTTSTDGSCALANISRRNKSRLPPMNAPKPPDCLARRTR